MYIDLSSEMLIASLKALIPRIDANTMVEEQFRDILQSLFLIFTTDIWAI